MARAEERKERYQQLRASGFSASEARALRDRKESVRTSAIRTRKRTIARREQRAKLKAAGASRVEANVIASQIRTKQERKENFSRWSNIREGFPDDIQRQITAWNRERGLSGRNSYGYRKFYWLYVEGVEFSKIDRILESPT